MESSTTLKAEPLARNLELDAAEGSIRLLRAIANDKKQQISDLIVRLAALDEAIRGKGFLPIRNPKTKRYELHATRHRAV